MKQAVDILKVTEAKELLPGDTAAKVKKAFRALVQQWHPDHSSDPMAREVFDHLMRLKDQAINRLNVGAAKPSVSDLKERFYETTNGKTFRFKYVKAHQGDLGDILVGKSTISYEVSEEFSDVSQAEQSAISNFKFADAGMRSEMEKFLPKLKERWQTNERVITILDKPADTVLLSDLIDHMGGKIPALHVAWIVSALENIACYLNWNGIAHGAISPTTVLVCPEYHSVILAGGWGFATKFGSRPIALPERTTSVLPRLALAGETVNERVDLELIRATALEMLGAQAGGSLSFDKETPVGMKEWLQLPPSKTAPADYRSWMACLEKSFGKRKFIEMGVTPSDVYKI